MTLNRTTRADCANNQITGRNGMTPATKNDPPFSQWFPTRLAIRIQMSSTGTASAVSSDEAADALTSNPASPASVALELETAFTATRNEQISRNKQSA